MNKPSPWADAEPRRRWMPPEEFVLLLEQSGQAFWDAAENLKQCPPESWSEWTLSTLAREAKSLEDFLDAHGARASQAFYPLRKSVACTLWLSQALSCLVHLRGRLEVYPSVDEFWTQRRLPEILEKSVRGLGKILLQTTEVLSSQWLTAECKRSPGACEAPHPGVLKSKILAADRVLLQDTEGLSDGAVISPAARLASRYLGFFDSWTQEIFCVQPQEGAMISFLENYCRERTVRSFQARAHNWQSDYDSLLRGTKEEQEIPGLLCLRGAMSQALHFLEAMVALSHLFERHRPGLAISEENPASRYLVSKEFLELFVVGCAQPAYRSLEIGAEQARVVLSGLTEEDCAYVTLKDGIHLHARPLSLLVRLTQHHGLPVSMSVGGQSASTDSLMQLLLLTGQNSGQREFRFEGDSRVLEEIVALFEANLGEEGIADLPERFEYLKH